MGSTITSALQYTFLYTNFHLIVWRTRTVILPAARAPSVLGSSGTYTLFTQQKRFTEDKHVSSFALHHTCNNDGVKYDTAQKFVVETTKSNGQFQV